jgi:SNF2 family DNA or RNA helicase
MFEEFCYKLSEIVHVCRKQDMTDITLPSQKHVIHNIDLSLSERTAYDTMARDLLLQINSKEIKAANVLSEVMKLRQLTSGFVYGQDGNDTETHRTGETKFEYLKQLIDQEPEEQRIHFINFREEARQMSKLPNSAVIDGTSKKNPEIFAAFRRGEIQHLVANQQSMSHGVTFVNCARTTYYSMNHSYELSKQSRDRTHRIGQTRDCQYDYIHAKNTMDGLIFQACVRKEATVNAFLAVLVEIQNGGTPVFTDAQEVFQESFNDIMKQLTYQHLREEA